MTLFELIVDALINGVDQDTAQLLHADPSLIDARIDAMSNSELLRRISDALEDKP